MFLANRALLGTDYVAVTHTHTHTHTVANARRAKSTVRRSNSGHFRQDTHLFSRGRICCSRRKGLSPCGKFEHFWQPHTHRKPRAHTNNYRKNTKFQVKSLHSSRTAAVRGRIFPGRIYLRGRRALLRNPSVKGSITFAACVHKSRHATCVMAALLLLRHTGPDPSWEPLRSTHKVTPRNKQPEEKNLHRTTRSLPTTTGQSPLPRALSVCVSLSSEDTAKAHHDTPF